MARAEFNPSENPTRRGAKPGKMSYRIRREIFLVIQPDRASQLLISNQSESERKILLSSITGLFPTRGKNASESKRMISMLESGDSPSEGELRRFSDKIWMTVLSRLIDLEIRDNVGGDILGVGRKKAVQAWLPDFSVVVWELLQDWLPEILADPSDSQ